MIWWWPCLRVRVSSENEGLCGNLEALYGVSCEDFVAVKLRSCCLKYDRLGIQLSIPELCFSLQRKFQDMCRNAVKGLKGVYKLTTRPIKGCI